ncbi:MAG: glycoside hydrolase family 2 TIM barrel-domain containing protein [Christensenellales bacterium]|jgi:beta-galactosidase
MDPNRIWPRPTLYALPDPTEACPRPAVSLNGTWRLNLRPGEDFASPETDISLWEEVTVPYQLSGRQEGPYAYAREVCVPEDWKESAVILRFDGVNCDAKIYWDGFLCGSHYGGFVSWNCVVTPLASPGIHRLTVLTEDKPMEVNPFHTGGIIRDVTLYRLADTPITRLQAFTAFDPDYRDAKLTVMTGVESPRPGQTLKLSLLSPDGQPELTDSFPAEADLSREYEILSPLKWDSEHPNLYTLSLELHENGKLLQKTHKDIGFRQIEKRGNQVFINGDLLKLRGVNRHDIYPLTGRAVTHELVEQDIRLFKEANINFIRTSHYPPRPDFVALCDRYGIYVENETSVAFIGQSILYTQNDPSLTPAFIGPLADIMERDLSSPSVIIWSLANECYWGDNFRLMHRYARAVDPTRLTIFSYPITQQEDDDLTDIWSMHYAAWEQDPHALVDSFDRSRHWDTEIPVLHDESTHIPCYCRNDLRRDPAVRDFWGETIKRFWDRLWAAPGALGCAIWAGIDDVRLTDRRPMGFGAPWGIIDGWRRRKPEFWHCRKAFSPLRVKEETLDIRRDGSIRLTIENRFNHTDLSEITMTWRTGRTAGSVMLPPAAPRETAHPAIFGRFMPGDTLEIEFTDAAGNCLDEYALPIEPAAALPPILCGSPPRAEDAPEGLSVYGDTFCLLFSHETGLILLGESNGRTVLTGGPYLHLTGLELGPWSLEKMDWEAQEDCVRIRITGSYDRVKAGFDLRIDSRGQMETTYTLLDMPYSSPRKLAMRIGDDTDSGGYEEVGLRFEVPRTLDTLSWQRKGLWTIYPDWHIGRLKGVAPMRYAGSPEDPYAPPTREWQHVEKDVLTFGPYCLGLRGTNDFRGTKPNILEASLSGGGASVTALSDGSQSVRMELAPAKGAIIDDTDPRVVYTGNWVRRDTRFRSHNSTETWAKDAGCRAKVAFTGTGILWFSATDILNGSARVFVDGEEQPDRIHLGARLGPGIPRGYERSSRQMVYSVSGLPMGEHTLEIEVTGEPDRGCSSAYVPVDCFVVLGSGAEGTTRFIVTDAHNYPELSWGDYTHPPVMVSTGTSGKVFLKLGS